MNINIWETPNGKAPVGDFIAQQDPQTGQRIMKDIDRLASSGLDLMRTDKVKHLKGYKNLYELRTFNGNMGYRTIFTIKNGEAWLLESFPKRGDGTPKRYLENALRRQRLLNN